MNAERSATPGTAARTRARSRRMAAPLRSRRMARRLRSEPGWRGESRYLEAGEDVLRAAVDDGAVRRRRLHRVGDAQEVTRADEHVDLGERLPELVGVALGEAAGDDQAPAGARGLHARQVEDGVDGLLLG